MVSFHVGGNSPLPTTNFNLKAQIQYVSITFRSQTIKKGNSQVV